MIIPDVGAYLFPSNLQSSFYLKSIKGINIKRLKRLKGIRLKRFQYLKHFRESCTQA